MELETFFTVSEQTRLLLCAILLGVPIGLCYDLLRTLRLLIRHGVLATVAEDLLFLLLWGAALLCFSAMLARGEFRVYFFFGSFLGFLVYRCTLGVCIVPFLHRILAWIRRLLGWLFCPVFYGIVRICRTWQEKFIHFAEVFGKQVFFCICP